MMPTATPFSLRIFVANGDPDGLRLAERSNWIGKAVIFPRALLPEIKTRAELSQTGVYLLIGPRDDSDGEKLYIGEGDPVLPRLQDHYSKKDFWNKAVFFVASQGQLNKAHVQYLEAKLVMRAQEAKRMPLDNGNTPAEPTLSEADQADMEVFLDHLLTMLPVLGIHAFEQAPTAKPVSITLLRCQGKGAHGTGYESTQGFVVQTGSKAMSETVPSLKKHVPGIFELRRDLIERGVLTAENGYLRFTQDYVFSSPSQAAAVVLGRNANGRVEWKDMHGSTLKELQSQQIVSQ